MNKPTLEQKDGFHCVGYSYKSFNGWQWREEAFKHSKYANEYYLLKIQEYQRLGGENK